MLTHPPGIRFLLGVIAAVGLLVPVGLKLAFGLSDPPKAPAGLPSVGGVPIFFDLADRP